MDKMAVVDLQTTDPTEFAKRARKLYDLLASNGYMCNFHKKYDDTYLSDFVGMYIQYRHEGVCAVAYFTSLQDPTAKYEDYFGLFNPFL